MNTVPDPAAKIIEELTGEPYQVVLDRAMANSKPRL